MGVVLLYYIEYATCWQLSAYADDPAWTRYKPGFESEERAENEAAWLALDDSQYMYRIVEDE